MPDIATFERDKDGKLPAWAWPGGYPLYYIAKDRGTFCTACANGENGSDAAKPSLDPDDPSDDQWLIIAGEVNWEDAALYCDHCYQRIESAYAEDDVEPDPRLSVYRADDPKRVDAEMREVRNTEKVFWSEQHNSYVIVAAEGPEAQWRTKNGVVVALLSINGIGEVRWFVSSHSSGTAGDFDARDYFHINPRPAK